MNNALVPFDKTFSATKDVYKRTKIYVGYNTDFRSVVNMFLSYQEITKYNPLDAN